MCIWTNPLRPLQICCSIDLQAPVGVLRERERERGRERVLDLKGLINMRSALCKEKLRSGFVGFLLLLVWILKRFSCNLSLWLLVRSGYTILSIGLVILYFCHSIDFKSLLKKVLNALQYNLFEGVLVI